MDKLSRNAIMWLIDLKSMFNYDKIRLWMWLLENYEVMFNWHEKCVYFVWVVMGTHRSENDVLSIEICISD